MASMCIGISPNHTTSGRSTPERSHAGHWSSTLRSSRQEVTASQPIRRREKGQRPQAPHRHRHAGPHALHPCSCGRCAGSRRSPGAAPGHPPPVSMVAPYLRRWKSGVGSGDNGAFLSILVTALAAFLVWALVNALHGPGMQTYNVPGVTWFIISGLLTIVIGRALFFKSIIHLGAIRASAVNRLN